MSGGCAAESIGPVGVRSAAGRPDLVVVSRAGVVVVHVGAVRTVLFGGLLLVVVVRRWGRRRGGGRVPFGWGFCCWSSSSAVGVGVEGGAARGRRCFSAIWHLFPYPPARRR